MDKDGDENGAVSGDLWTRESVLDGVLRMRAQGLCRLR